MALSDCIDAVRSATGRTDLSEAQALEIMGAVEERAKLSLEERRFATREEALAAAGQEFADMAQASAIIERRNALYNFRKRVAATQFVKDAPNAVIGIEALLDGVNMRWTGSRFSTAARMKVHRRNLQGGFGIDLRNVGAEAIARKGTLDKQWGEELFELSRGENGTPGKTGNDTAKRMAEVAFRYQRQAVDMQNREGGWIGTYDGYVTRTVHNPDRIRRATYDQWKRDAITWFDPDRTFEGVEDQEKFLKGLYNAFITGIHLTYEGMAGLKDPAFKGPGNLAKRISEGRTIHFRDFASWWAYREKYGNQATLVSDLLGQLDRGARNTALMEVWGTNPRYEFEALQQRTIERLRDLDPDQAKAVKDKRKPFENLFDNLDGTANLAINRSARFNTEVRSVISMAKLGGVLASSVTDLAAKAQELKYQGVGFLESYANGLTSIARGRGRTAETREFFDDLRAGTEGMLGNVASRFDPLGDTPLGTMSAMTNRFFRLTGLTYWTDAQKAGAEHAMSRRIGRQKSKSWDSLKRETRRILDEFAITPADWEILRQTDWRLVNRRSMFMPDAALQLSDDAVDARLPDEVASIRARPGEMRIAAAERGVKEDIGVEKKLARLADKKDRAIARLDEMQSKRGEKFAKQAEAIQARIDLYGARLSLAEAETDLSQSLRGMERQDYMRDLLYRARNDMRSRSFTIAGRSDRSVERGAREVLRAGERLGEKRAKAERSIKDMEKRARDAEAAVVEKNDAETQALLDTLKEREAEVSAFIDRVRERQEARVEAASTAEDLVEPRLERLRDDYRRELAMKIHALFADRVDAAVPTPGVREMAILRQGLQPGTVSGEAVRYITQFKAFPVTYITKVLGRERAATREAFRTGEGRMSAVGGIVHLFAMTTALGYVAMAAKDLSKGRDVRDPFSWDTMLAAMAQGGGLGIYGDFIFGDFNRFGRSAASTLLGPTFGQVDDVVELWGHLKGLAAGTSEGKDIYPKTARFLLNNAPFINLIYTRAALDYLFLYQLSEAMNPGYLKRMEKRIKDENAQTFFLPPSKAIPRGGGGRILEGVR